jgi:hypothetical protein
VVIPFKYEIMADMSNSRTVIQATITLSILAILIPSHFSIVNNIRSDYESKIDVIEREKNDAISEKNRYYNYLVSVPGSYDGLEQKIDTLNKENINLLSELANYKKDDENQSPENYEKSYYIKKNSSIEDEKTGLTIGLLNISNNFNTSETKAKINVHLPYRPIGEKEVQVGDSFYFDAGEDEYKILIEEVNWYSDSIDIKIYLPEYQKAKFVKKKFLFEEE